MTDQGTVILARVNLDWVLAVLFDSEFQLGGALSRTKAVTDLLIQVDLPPPPSSVEIEEEISASVSEMEPEPVSTEVEKKIDFTAPIELLEPDIVFEEAIPEPEPEIPVVPEIEEFIEPEEEKEVEVQHGCVVHRSDRYNESMTLESVLNSQIKKEFSNTGIDILLVVDQKMTVYKIAEHLSRPVEKTIEIISWCVSRNILRVECPDEQEPTQKEIIELPLFEGNIDKVKKKHRSVIELCDGKRTLQEIATEVGIPYFEALQSILPYRGKTLRIIRTDKSSRF
jgi:hypothetical protein